MGVGWNVTPCGDIYNPPSRSNMSIFAIIEIVIMGVIAILCLMELFDFIENDKGGDDFIKFLVIVDDILIVVALCYIVIGLFFSFCGGSKLKMGILLFVAAGILAMIILILQINKGVGDEIWYKIFYLILILFLTFILFKQQARL